MHKTVDQISVFLENRPGQLSEILTILKDANINIAALNIAETEKYGVLRLIVEKPQEALKCLKKLGCIASTSPVFIIGVPNELGGLKNLIDIITKEKINIDYMYSMVELGENNSTAYMSIAVNDPVKMNDCLKKHNIESLEF